MDQAAKSRGSAALLSATDIIREVGDEKFDRNTLRRWTDAKWVKTEPVEIGTRKVRAYPRGELAKIKRMLELVRQGYSPKSAYRRTMEELNPHFEDRLRSVARRIVVEVNSRLREYSLGETFMHSFVNGESATPEQQRASAIRQRDLEEFVFERLVKNVRPIPRPKEEVE